MQRAERSARGSRGGARPGAVGADLVEDVRRALACVPGVAVERNAVMAAVTKSGREVLTGVGGKGAPDLYVEVPTPAGVRAALWLECKAGTGELNPDQRKWHERARVLNRHAYVVRSVEHARAIVESFKRGEVHVD